MKEPRNQEFQEWKRISFIATFTLHRTYVNNSLSACTQSLLAVGQMKQTENTITKYLICQTSFYVKYHLIGQH